jgi:pyruvate dehydrogenase E2 component (dihydrolipoamide acetyltransferase)
METDRVIYRFGDCELDEGRYELRRGGVPCHLEPQVFEVLAYLVRNRGRLVTKAELLDEIWGSRFVSESALTSRIKAARKAVGDSGREQRVIRTVHGRGYEFLTPVQPPATGPSTAAARAGAVDSGEPAPSASATLPLRGAEPGTGPVPAATAPRAAEDVDEVPLSAMRRTVARRLVESMQSTPHVYLTITVDAEALLAFRAELNRQLRGGGEDLKVSVNDLIVKACAGLLRTNPDLNVSWGGDKLLVHRRVHVGIAVALDGGLVVPVVRDADRKALTQVAREAKELAGKARAGKLAAAELTGGTFTVSNLGMYGIDRFTAVINPPEAAILAVGAAVAEPVATEDGGVEVHRRMRLTLSIDHRALDGATGARFLAQLKSVLEQPLQILA